MKAPAVVALLILAGCSPLEPTPLEAPAQAIVTREGSASTSSAKCRVEVEAVPAPTSGPHYWVKATYRGACIDPNGRQYPYWPAPRWGLTGNASVGAQQWGADWYYAYVWPEVPGTYTVRATAPVGASGTVEVTIP